MERIAEEVYESITDEVFSRGAVEDWQTGVLVVLARFLVIDRERSIAIARKSREKKLEAGTGASAQQVLAGFVDYLAALQGQESVLEPLTLEVGRLLGLPEQAARETFETHHARQAGPPAGAATPEPDVAARLSPTLDFGEEESAPVSPEFVQEEAELVNMVKEAERLGSHPPRLAIVLFNLAEFYRKASRYAKARNLYERSLAIRVQLFGPEHPVVAQGLLAYAEMLETLHHSDEALSMRLRARQILSRRPEGPEVVRKIRNDTARARPFLPPIQERLTWDAPHIDRGRERLVEQVGALPPDPKRLDLKLQLEIGRFQALKDGYVVTEGYAQVIGTYLLDHKAWIWGWMNPEVPLRATDRIFDRVKADAMLRQLAECSMFQIRIEDGRKLGDWVSIRLGTYAAYPMEKGTAITFLYLEPGV